jgi:hypothetical protein
MRLPDTEMWRLNWLRSARVGGDGPLAVRNARGASRGFETASKAILTVRRP